MSIRRSACPLDCPDSCSLEVSVRDGRVESIDGSHANPLTAGFICSKVRRFGDYVHGPHRLRHPLIRSGAKGEGRFQQVSWDDALGRVVEQVERVRQRHGGEGILPVCYGGSNGMVSQDSIDLRLFHRLGATRLARTLCAAPSGAAAKGLYGKIPGVALTDYDQARLVIIWGCNPSVSGIHLVPHLQRARAQGARLVVIDPRRTPLARGADLHLAPKPGTDLPLALALIRCLFDTGAADAEFLDRHTNGAEELRRRATVWNPERAARVCGLEASQIEDLASLYAESSPAVVRCGWGVERNRNGGSAVAAILALPAVAGKFGVRGGGYTMSFTGAWSLDSQPAVAEPAPATRVVNLNQVGRALCALDDPPVELVFIYNANPLMTLPDQERVRRGLLRDDLFTVVYDQVVTDTARYADVVLPATTFLEQDELALSYGTGLLQRALPAIPAVGEARPNYAVFADLCRRLGLSRDTDPETPDDLVGALLGDLGSEVCEALDRDGVALPACGLTPLPFVDVMPATSDGRINLVPADLDAEAPDGLYAWQEETSDQRYPLALISPAQVRTITSTMGQLDPRPARLSLCHPDAEARGVKDGDVVRVFNSLGEVRCLARLDDDLRPGVVMLPKGLWSQQTLNGSTANALVPDGLTDLGGGACFNDARVEVERVSG